MSNDETLRQLEAFDADAQLSDLEKALSRFNLFDAVGATHKELWHSDFLAFLLNPAANHGLGDVFTRRFVAAAVPDLEGAESLGHVRIRREHQFVDILIEDEIAQASIIVENKIWSPEGRGQLPAYWRAISAEHPGWSTYGVFLTPRGQAPSDLRYRPLSYSVVARLLEEILAEGPDSIQADVQVVVQHYIDMLRRSIVGNADTSSVARQLYFRHKAVLKLMDPDLWKTMIERHLQGLVADCPLLSRETSTTEYVRFRVSEWDGAEGLKHGTGKNTSYDLLFFDWYNFDNSLTLYLWLSGRVPPEAHARILQLCRQCGAPFREPVERPHGWYYCYMQPFLTADHYTSLADEELLAEIDAQWQQFVGHDLPAITETFRQQEWFWRAG